MFADAVELNVKESIAKALQSGLEGDALAQRITDLYELRDLVPTAALWPHSGSPRCTAGSW